LNWFNFQNRRDRETLGRQVLGELRRIDVKIAKLLAQGRALLKQQEPVEAHEEFGDWVAAVSKWLENDFGSPGLSAAWSGLSYSSLVTASGYNNSSTAWTHFRTDVARRLTWLGKALTTSSIVHSTSKEEAKRHASDRIFVVHGHDGETREAIARFLDKLGLRPIILHEQPNKGRTIITKFREEAAGVGFAIVIMTPDDVGKANGEDQQKPRSRQNVVFELGFFIGALGSERVAAVVRGNVERPSDFDGVVYISFDQADWPVKLGQELQAAGYQFDWNRIMGS
jgi:predicted nucleotide-binding protein